QLFVRGQQLHTLEVSSEDQVGILKAHLELVEGIPVSCQVLLFGGRPLDNGMLSGEAGLSELSTIDLNVRLLGGKVHGSLARAGKVRGQTPKVDPQEDKKKPKVGRAKRRMQYNRRVNVAPVFGKRKGPNSNS
ncbi:30S ribosomal protein S30e, partial [Salmonella sp. s55044]|uniref:30S ribosomal protein S30e n=1 Tax=Salmonella sp. s55044 TaxID=3159677 RepID=UPI003980FEA0